MAKQIKSIVNRSGLLRLADIADLFGGYKPETFLKKWHNGEPIIREIKLRKIGRIIVADERNVYKVLERYKEALPLVVPRWKENK